MSDFTVRYDELPIRFDIRQLPGNTIREPFSFDIETDTGTSDLDLSGCTFTVTIYRGEYGGTTVQGITAEIDTDDASSGKIELRIDDTDELSGRYYYTVTAEFDASHQHFPGDTKTLVAGYIEFGDPN